MAPRAPKARTVSSQHAAPGQAAGYLFQPERALYWLATTDAGAAVGIETDDDIAVQVRGQVTSREQLKSSTSVAVPFGDHSIDLWKTLLIWLDAAAADEFDPDRCQLYLTTNVAVGDCFARRVTTCKTNKSALQCVDALLNQRFPPTVADYVARLRKHDRSLVARVLRRIQLLDATENSAGPALRTKVVSSLHLPADVGPDEIIDGLLGWIHSTVLELWRGGKPAWLTRSSFDKQLHKLLRKHHLYRIVGLPAHFINVPVDEQRKRLNWMFVKQLHLIAASQQEVLGAVDDHFRCCTERLRLSAEGELNGDDWIDFDGRLTVQWRILSQAQLRSEPARAAVDNGYSIYASELLSIVVF